MNTTDCSNLKKLFELFELVLFQGSYKKYYKFKLFTYIFIKIGWFIC